VGFETYRAYRELMASDRFQCLANSGARMQRLLWASTGTKDPDASDTLYVEGLASPFTVNTMPDSTLEAFYDHGVLGTPVPSDGGDHVALLERFSKAGVDKGALALKLQDDGATSFSSAWSELLSRIDAQLANAKADS
jgi:transaldolase